MNRYESLISLEETTISNVHKEVVRLYKQYNTKNAKLSFIINKIKKELNISVSSILQILSNVEYELQEFKKEGGKMEKLRYKKKFAERDFDGTGPEGKGPRTGRGLGNCDEEDYDESCKNKKYKKWKTGSKQSRK